MTIRNMIFDVDGTLWDITPLAAKSWTRAGFELGYERGDITADELKGLFGKPMDYIMHMLFPGIPKDKTSEYMQHCSDVEFEVLAGTQEDFLYPAVCETVKKLSEKYGLYIVSNCQCGYIEIFLEKSGLSAYFKDFSSFGATGLQKGDNIRLVIERNHLKDAVYIGDIQSDCDAARLARVPFIHAAYGYGKVDKPDIVISQFSDLSHI